MPTKTFSLYDLFVLKLKSLYDTEQQLVKALPKMAKASTDKELREGFADHTEETKSQVRRLEEVFKLLGIKPQKTKVEAIRGLIEDAVWCIDSINPENALDVSLVAAASYVEHYEMAGYISARNWAEELGLTDVASLLQETLNEEMAADERLMRLSTERLNAGAVDIGTEE